MTDDTTPWMSATIGGVVGAALAAAAPVWRFGFAGGASLLSLPFVLIVGVIPGVSFGTLGWALVRPGKRITRTMMVSIAVVLVAWGAFLVTTPPLSSAEFEVIAAARRDARNGRELITDQPTVMAGRWFGGFRSMPIPERALVLLTGPVPDLAAYYVVPMQYAAMPPTRRESYVIGAIAFTLSTAFWPGAVGLVGHAGRRWRRPPRVQEPPR